MSSAATLRDQLVPLIEDLGFGALGMHVLVGEDEAEHHWQPDDRREIHSVAKAVGVLAALIAADEGILGLDYTVCTTLQTPTVGAGTEQITLRDLLAMRSGVDLPWTPTLLTDWPDLAVEFLSRPAPVRAFQYSNASSYVAMRMLEAHVGDVMDYVAPRLFEPLGIDGVTWQRCPLGHVAGGEGIALRVTELARLGRLIRDGGLWHGRRIVSEHAIAAIHTGWGAALSSPGYESYALGAWNGPGDGWRLHGAYGQMLLFHGDVVVTIAADDHFGADDAAARIMQVIAA